MPGDCADAVAYRPERTLKKHARPAELSVLRARLQQSIVDGNGIKCMDLIDEPGGGLL